MHSIIQNDNRALVDLLVSLDVALSDARTYTALLEINPLSIRKIATHTSINRGTTYDALKRLTALGLVSVRRRGNREHYSAESPDKIFDLIRDKRRDLEDAAVAAKELVPNLTARKGTVEGQPLVRYYQEDEGVVAILKDVLQTCRDLPKREYYAYSSSPVRQYLYRKFPQFTKRRIAEDIHVKVIAVGEGGEIAEKSERKWLVSPHYTSSYTLIYGDKIATVSITKHNIPYGVIIEDSGAASLQRLLFDQLWNYIDTKPDGE